MPGDSYPKLKVAAIQAAPVFQNREATVEKSIHLIEEAKRLGAVISAFSEGFLSGFPRNSTFETPEITRSKYLDLYKNAVEIPSKDLEQLSEAARQNEMVVVMGSNEKEKGRIGTVYNTQIFFGSDGRLLGKHRKLVPTFTEKLIYGGGDGSTINVFETEFGKIGGLICGEHNNPLEKFAMYAMGEAIHVASWPPFPSPKMSPHQEYTRFASRQYALEGKSFVIAATGFFSKEMLEDVAPQFREGLTESCASSMIISPRYGRIIAEAPQNKEAVLCAEIDLEEGIPVRLMHDLTGHYNRFDVLSLNINRRKLEPMNEVAESSSETIENAGMIETRSP
ncbi:MAG: carbon-nitrogen hydrolase family protein [Thaumarchaeota archaeon]|nr:carbon-nitrogen hydrolase family protein [Nitrososphaerota archaeon]